MKMSQSTLGVAVGVSFKQIQKYETGANSISAGRLYDICEVLDIEIDWLFEGLPRSSETGVVAVPKVADRESARLVNTYYDIRDEGLRRHFLGLLRSIADNY